MVIIWQRKIDLSVLQRKALTPRLMLTALSETRGSTLAEVPTCAQAGFPEFADDTWYGMFVPAGTPREITNHLNHELRETLSNPELKKQQEAEGRGLMVLERRLNFRELDVELPQLLGVAATQFRVGRKQWRKFLTLCWNRVAMTRSRQRQRKKI